MGLGRYRKLIAAVVGIAILIATRYYNVDVPGLQPVIMDVIIGGLTSVGVFQATND